MLWISESAIIASCVRGGGQEVVAADVQLLPDAWLLLDMGTELVLWEGQRAPKEISEIIWRFACALAAQRHPEPRLVRTAEADPLESLILSRLEPCRKDSPEVQREACPILKTLTPLQQHHFVSRLGVTDDLSFNEWRAKCKLLRQVAAA